jgi:hypothetical protein
MYLIEVDGRREGNLHDLAGVYRVVARMNPVDGTPLALDPRAVVKQMTCDLYDCLIPTTTRDALHKLVWGAASGKVTEHRFITNGPLLRVTVQPGTEYKQMQREYGPVKPASAPTSRTSVREYAATRRYAHRR